MSHSAASEHLDPVLHADEIRAQTERILSSHWFQKTRRNTQFLRYIVDKTLSGRTQDIKERSIGIEIFGRSADYDLANDAIVRVAAAELRKRLAQYYINDARAGELRIELPSGSYVPTFSLSEVPDSAAAPSEPPPSVLDAVAEPRLPDSHPASSATSSDIAPQMAKGRTGLHFLLWGGVLTAVVLAGAIFTYQTLPNRPLDAFWAPIFTSQHVTLCIGDLNWIMPDHSDPATEPVSQLMSSRNHVGQHDVGALTRLSNYLGQHRKLDEVYLADNTNLTDLRTEPTVFIGAFDNQWTKRILADQRFRLELDTANNQQTLVDSQDPKHPKWSIALGQPLSAISRDYAIVVRVNSSLTGQTDVIAAGLGPYGTTAASEFVSTPEYFKEFASRAPRGWESKNIEIVLSTDVVDGRSAPPRVIAYSIQ